MKNRLYLKTVWRDIRDSFGRFAAIVIIIFMSVLLFVGIKSVGPDLNQTADHLIKEQGVSDLQIVSTGGLVKKDLAAVTALADVKGELGQRIAIHEESQQLTLQLYSYQATGENQPIVTKGRLPKKSTELFLDRMLAKNYPLGTKITLKDEQLKETQFTVVGLGNSPIYVDDRERGVTNVGDGQVAGFAYVPLAAFDNEISSIMYLSFLDLRNNAPTSEAYKSQLEKKIATVEELIKKRRSPRLEELQAVGEEKLASETKNLADNKEKLAQGEKELAKGKAQLAKAEKELASNEAELLAQEEELKSSQITLNENQGRLTAEKEKLAANQKTLDQKAQELAAGQQQLTQQQTKLTEQATTLREKQAELAANQTLLTDKKAELTQQQQTLTQQKQMLTESIDALAKQQADLTQQQQNLTTQESQLTSQERELKNQQQALAQKREELEATIGKEAADEELKPQETALKTQLTQVQASLKTVNEAQGKLAIAKEKLADSQASLPQQLSQVEAALAKIADGLNELSQQEAPLKAAAKELAQAQGQLAAGQAELTAAQEKLNQGKSQLAAGQAQLTAGQQQLTAGQEELTTGQKQLTEGLQAIETSKQQLADGKKELAENQKKLAANEKKLQENQKKLAEGEEKLASAKEEIATIAKPNYLLTQRQDNPGFNEFQSLAQRIDAIANVFPVFFFLIAILIIFTSMTRLIEEHRREIGTLKALGYRNGEIAAKYLLYAFTAMVIGSLAGVIVGTKILPPVVFNMLKEQYIYEKYPLSFWGIPILIAVAAAAFSTLVSSGFVLISDLREKPTTLLNPRGPKSGQRVLLEHLPALWQRLNFNQKVAYRNIFRYKARGLLTIFGIAGCTGLMVAGFGLQDSIPAPAAIQFSQMVHYDGILSLENQRSQAQLAKVADLLADQEEITAKLAVTTQQVTFQKTGITKQTASLYVVDPDEDLEKFVTLQDIKQHTLALNNQGALVSRPLAELFEVGVGDTLPMTDDQGVEMKIKVAGIFNQYLGHTLYLTPTYFHQLTETKEITNAYFFKAPKLTTSSSKTLAKSLYEDKNILNVTYMADQLKKQDAMTESIGPIVFIFILLSAVLAFVVLYNLTNINISERQREMATIKVLGFFDQEVTMYLFRETVAFTLLGIPLGFVVGRLLTWFILTMASSDTINFPIVISWQGYLVAAVMTTVFTGIVTVVTHFKLKKIHMIEALKSNE